MGVEGCLEDLGICEILQILSLSKKTGTLHLDAGGCSGSITFLRGQVIRAVSDRFPRELGQLLKHCRLITEEQLCRALEYQKQLDLHRPLGEVVVELYKVPSSVIEKAIARQIEQVILSFVPLRVGTFRFSIENISSYGAAQLNPLDLMLEKGLSPQRLALKGRKAIGCEAFDDASLDRELAELEQRHSSKGLDLLRGMLAELERPEFSGGVVLLILRYASEIMKRAVVFDLRGDAIVGIGQFGLRESGSLSADEMVRRMRLTADRGSVFGKVLRSKSPYWGAIGDSPAEQRLVQMLGHRPDTVFLGPLLNEGRVVAMLYGEFAAKDIASAKIEAFNVFLGQAGLAIEQALQ